MASEGYLELFAGNAVSPSPLLPSRGGPRSRRGCWTCRSPQVKKRCDERRPNCGRCTRRNLHCDYSARPTLAQRRRGEIAVVQKTPRDNSTTSLSIVNPTADAIGACSLILSNADHEAIRFFRTACAKFHHTKNPGYSVFSIMFDIAKEDPMVMHMVISLGEREMDLRRPFHESRQERNPLRHYASALRLMADAISPENESQDIDAIYTALWLMLLYEQQFGDSGCKAYTNHLAGAASLLQHRGQKLLQFPSSRAGRPEQAPALLRRSHGQNGSKLSVYSARIIVWISLLDAAAASSGFGGQVNGTLVSLLLNNTDMRKDATPVDAFSRLHRYSNPLFRLVWGDNYPQSELLDDVENRNIYALMGQCGQLRFMVAQLANLYRKDVAAAVKRADDVDASIEHVGYIFTELMEVASDLSPDTDNSQRLVANIRAIVPLYHAVVLDFMRISAFDQPLGDRQRHALREIMNLAYQSFKHDGDEAMIRVAWPLFIAAIETDDLLHRDWVLDRFAAISKYGNNFERAHLFLKDFISAQQRLGKRIELRTRLEQAEQFVLA